MSIPVVIFAARDTHARLCYNRCMKHTPDNARSTTVLHNLSHIDLSTLEQRVLLCDLDNTLAPHNGDTPTVQAQAFIDAARQCGKSIIIVSNNGERRVADFAKRTRLPYLHSACKPLTARTRRMLRERGIDLRDCAFIGDQVFTDKLLARSLRIPFILVPPVSLAEETFFIRVKRGLERLIR